MTSFPAPPGPLPEPHFQFAITTGTFQVSWSHRPPENRVPGRVTESHGVNVPSCCGSHGAGAGHGHMARARLLA